MSYIFTFIIGGVLVTAVSFLSKNGHPDYSGVTMTIPAITIAGLLMSSKELTSRVALWGLLGVISTAFFLISFIAIHHFMGNKYIGIFCSLVIWTFITSLFLKLRY